MDLGGTVAANNCTSVKTMVLRVQDASGRNTTEEGGEGGDFWEREEVSVSGGDDCDHRAVLCSQGLSAALLPGTPLVVRGESPRGAASSYLAGILADQTRPGQKATWARVSEAVQRSRIPETRSLKTRSLKLENRNPKLEACNPKPETRNSIPPN